MVHIPEVFWHLALPLVVAVFSAWRVWRVVRARNGQSWGPWALLMIVGLGYAAWVFLIVLLAGGYSASPGPRPVYRGEAPFETACRVEVFRIVRASGMHELECSMTGGSNVLRNADGYVIRPVGDRQMTVDAICRAHRDFDLTGSAVELGRTMGGQERLRKGCVYSLQCLVDHGDARLLTVSAARLSGASHQDCVARDERGR